MSRGVAEVPKHTPDWLSKLLPQTSKLPSSRSVPLPSIAQCNAPRPVRKTFLIYTCAGYDCHAFVMTVMRFVYLYGIFAVRRRDGNDNTGLSDLYKTEAMMDGNGMKFRPLAPQFPTNSQQLFASHCFVSLIFQANDFFALKVVPCCADKKRGGSS